MAIPTIGTLGLHALNDVATREYGGAAQKQDVAFTYTFENFFHPFVGELIKKLNRESLPGMLDPDFHQGLATPFFDDFYTALTDFVTINPFDKEIDVGEGSPYANYNWELLFHIPITIAVHLSKNQRFAEAQRWFHYIFDPTEPTGRFWKFLAFQDVDVTQIDELLALLSKPDPDETEKRLRESILAGYDAIKNKPFQPHAVARTRHVAYQYCVVMKYLDNLIAWGDSLFRQDTIESINEATQRYVLAANLLGPRPQRIPRQGASRPKTFAELKQQGPDELDNVLEDLEGKFPFNLGPIQTQDTDPDLTGPLFGIGRTLYFCIPRNAKLLGYWDTVADRLYKIRNCMNIEGVVRQLALFEPPLDPGLLVKAAAAGIDIGSMAGGLNQPISPVRSLFLIQKALELCAEVRGLGNALLSAIEKGDGERMALLRQAHEIQIQQMAQEVRFLQWKQAQESTESLLRSRASVLERYSYYQRLLGLTPDSDTAPDTFPLDRRELTEENFDDAYDALVGQYEKAIPVQAYPQLRLTGDTSPANQSGASGKGQLYLNTNEDRELNEHMPETRLFQMLAHLNDVITAGLYYIPNFSVKMAYWGIGGGAEISGGQFLGNAAQAVSTGLRGWADYIAHGGTAAAKTASYERRADDWMLQSNLAARELMQIGRQVIGSLIAEQIAYREYQNIQEQIEQSQEVDRFLREKFTNAELYAWMQGEISRLYYEYYRFAFDTARKAEQTMKHELMRPEVDATDYVKFNYWDSGRRGLLSGEALYLDVKRMEMAYHENNKREYELTKRVSVRQLDPLALLTLKATGSCEVTLPEWLFDLDGAGHYMRRIKNVSLSIPSVTGPYTSVNCTLSLLKSSLRRSPEAGDQYGRKPDEDSRFVDYFGTVESIVTSSANNDSGMFEANLRDERFLPFEGAGAESTWKLDLPAEFRQFDYNTISDVILHIRYTARQGGHQLRTEAAKRIDDLIQEANTSSLVQLFSLKHDFPNEWHQFVTGNQDFTATVKKADFPYLAQGREITLGGVTLFSIEEGNQPQPVPVDLTTLSTTVLDGDDSSFELSLDDSVLTRDKDAQVFLLFGYGLRE
jgi:hypothetical protein